MLPAGWGRPGRGESQRPQLCSAVETPSPARPLPRRAPRPRRPSPVRARGPRGCGGVGPLLHRASLLPTRAPRLAGGRGARGSWAAGRGLTCASAACQARGLPLALRRPGPSRARGARVAGGAASPRCGSVSPCVRPAPGVDHSTPRSPSSLFGGRLGPSRRAEAGSGRRSSGGGRALRGARAGGCALLSSRGRELGPELAAAVAAAAPSAGPAPAGGSRAPRSAPRLLPAPAPPRQPAPGAPPGRDRASHLPPRPARPLLLGPDSGARVGSPPPGTPRTSTAHFARTLPGPPGAPKDSVGSSPGCSQRSCREPPAHIKHSHALYPPLGPPRGGEDLSFLAHKPEPFPWSWIPGQHPAEPSFG